MEHLLPRSSSSGFPGLRHFSFNRSSSLCHLSRAVLLGTRQPPLAPNQPRWSSSEVASRPKTALFFPGECPWSITLSVDPFLTISRPRCPTRWYGRSLARGISIDLQTFPRRNRSHSPASYSPLYDDSRRTSLAAYRNTQCPTRHHGNEHHDLEGSRKRL